MELREFIKNTLVELVGGVNDANKEIGRSKDEQEYLFQIYDSNDRMTSHVDFDLLVGTEKGEGARAGILSVIGGFGAETDQSNTSTNRIKFKIAIR